MCSLSWRLISLKSQEWCDEDLKNLKDIEVKFCEDSILHEKNIFKIIRMLRRFHHLKPMNLVWIYSQKSLESISSLRHGD